MATHALAVSGELAFERGALQHAVKIRLFKSADNTHTDAALFARFLAGDDAAFTALYTAHNQRLFNYCAKMLRDHDAAKDVVHAMWERVIAMRASAQPADTVRNPVGLFVRVARNLSLDHLKHASHQTQLDDASTMHTSTTSDDKELVVRAMERLPEETREILVLHYYGGYDFNEIAQMLGKKPNAVWTRVSRARAELKQILTSELEGAEQ